MHYPTYIQEPNERAYHVKVAFIATDSENLGEMVNDMYHSDFGDNKFPYVKGNTNVKIDLEKFKNDDDIDDEDVDDGATAAPRDQEANSINTFIPPSIIEYLSTVHK